VQQHHQSLDSCLQSFMKTESIDEYYCDTCLSNSSATKQVIILVFLMKKSMIMSLLRHFGSIVSIICMVWLHIVALHLSPVTMLLTVDVKLDFSNCNVVSRLSFFVFLKDLILTKISRLRCICH
jgi:ubiquitin C-terminal hydrolase